MPTLDEAIGSSPIDSAIDGVSQDRTRLRTSLFGAVKQNPDEAAQATQLSRTTGLPTPIIARNLQSVRQRSAVDALDAAIDPVSVVGRKMADPGFAALGHDDVGNLNSIEQTMNRGSGKIGIPFRRQDELRNSSGPEVGTSSVVSGILKSLPQGLELTRQGIRAQFADAMGFDAMSADAIKMGQRAQHDAHLSTPRFESSTAAAAYSGMTSLLRQMPGLAATIATRSPMPGLATIGVQTEAEAYNKYRARGATPGMAAVGGLGEGAVEVGTEMLPMSFLVNKFGKVGATQFLTGLLAREVPTEQIATLVQDAIDTAIANPDKTWQQYADERPGAAYHTLIATVVQGGAMGAISEVARRIGEPTAKAEQATKNAAAMEQISKLATESRLRTRDPQTFQEFVHAATEGGPVQDVYLDARVLAQSGVDVKALVQASPTAAAQLEHALATGGDVVIPVSEYAARIAGTPLDPILSPHLRTSEDALSLDEAQRFYQGQAASFQETAAKVMEEKAGDVVHAVSAKAVETKLLEQLDASGRFTPDVNKAYASLMRDFYVATASRTGLTPEQMYERYPLQIKAESVAGAQRLDQATRRDVGYHTELITKYADQARRASSLVPKSTNPLQRLAQAVKTTLGIQTPEAPPEVDGARLDMGQFFQGENKGNRGEISFGEDVSQAPSVITLFKNADLSTALHELGHFQLEVMANIAGRPDAPQAIVDDLNTVLEWLVIRGEGRTSLEVWNGMTLEEKRPYHEQFARGFESYLFEGKSPSLEMNSVFARFRAWLVSVYKSIKALNVEISDDIRKVFDRLVATEEAIKQAEAARKYNPIFKTAEEMGATPEEWTAYQQTNEQATQDAISGLQSRSLRDMRWLTNSRGRILKQLQKDAAAKRREARMEARREVLTDPTYKAWQFLTRKMGAEDQLPKMNQKSDPDTLDETRDSLLVAIAKLGGLRKDQVISEWGTDPADKPSSGLFGKPVWRIEGGLSIDGMAELLAQYGYLPKNEHGQHDLHDFEEAFADEMRGTPRYSNAHEYTQEMPAGYQVANPAALDAGRLDLVELRQIGIPDDVIAKLESRGMIATGDGLHPDIVAEIVGGFTSGDEMVRKVAAADDISAVIEGLTDQHMLERYGDITSPEALARAADSAIHNEARGRFVATELKALSKAVGPVRAITKAAKDFAESVISRKLVRDIKPLQHAASEVRAGKAAEMALIAGDTAQAAIEKRNQLVQNYSTRAAYDALDEIDAAVRYLRKFDKEGTRKNIDHEFTDQIDQLLERFDLRVSITNKAAAQRSSLLAWVESQREQGFEPDIPPEILSEAMRKPYKELTLEELRGLVDTVKQVEHLGRLKKKLLTSQDQMEFSAVVATLTASIEANAKHTVDLRTRNTTTAQLKDAGNRFLAMHRKMASVAREMDGFKDGGPMWEYFIRSMNEAGDKETTRRAGATARLYKLVKPFDKMGGKGQFFETLGASFNREERIAIALNLGNEGNMQRLLDGEGWTMEKLKPLLDTITPEEADFVQAIWDFFESYRPEIGEKETRIYGKEPQWVDPSPIILGGRQLRGGYYPIKYDPARSGRAEQHAEAEAAKQQMRGAYTTATTRRSFTKTRAREVTGRPLIYSFAGLYQGTNEVIHDLSWHEWLIDVNRLVRAVDAPIRAHYGAETVGIFKKAIEDIASGDSQVQNVFERGLNHLRTGATVAGLGWNLTTSLLQPLGLTQSMARIGSGWVVKGMGQWIKSPLETMGMIKEKSAMMTNRAQTMQREINEIQNQVNGSSLDPIRATFFVLIQKMQLLADVPTWLGAYEKHTAAGETEARSVALADQAVLDSQGGGQVKDLAQIQRGHPALKLFTNFYSYFNVSYNLAVEKTNEKIGSPKMYPSLAMDYILLLIAPSVLATLVRNIMSGDDDDLVDKLAADQISYLLGLMVGAREITAAVQKVAGVEQFKGSYGGPAGLRLFQEIDKLGTQIGQGEADAALLKSANNVGGILLHYPSGQINRSVEGTAAIMEGKTDNPAAVFLGPPRK